MAKIGVGDVLGSYAQSVGWKALNQYVNSNSRFGIFDSKGNPFYEAGLGEKDKQGFMKYFKFLSDSSVDNGVTALNYNKNYNVTTAPVESKKGDTGKTLAYNLVEQPRQGQVTYVSTGTIEQRKVFEDALEKAQKSMTLFKLHTAERSMNNIKIIGYSVNRSSSQGTQLIQYQITFQEILIIYYGAELSNAMNTYNDSSSQGQIETKAPIGSQIQAAGKTQ